MEKELGRFGVKYSFFPAVDGNKLTREERRIYSPKHAIGLQWPLTNLEIGCSLSHVYVYEKMVAQSIKEMLILEDDCVFDDHFFDVLNCRESWLPPGWGLINFHVRVPGSLIDHRAPLHNLGNLIPPLQLIALKRQRSSLVSYLINLHAAQQLLDIAYPIRMPSDRLTAVTSMSRLDTYTIFPLLVKTGVCPSTVRIRKRDPRIWQRRWVRLRYGVDYKSLIEEDHSPGTLKKLSRRGLIKEKVKKLLKQVRGCKKV